jgi:hypothetical protein
MNALSPSAVEFRPVVGPDLVMARRLLAFGHDVLAQGAQLADLYREGARPGFEQVVGPHLRHVIEHFEALAMPGQAGVVDYDSRPRDRELEKQPDLASARISALQRWLSDGLAPFLERPLRVRGLGGLGGEFSFEVVSTVARELVFLSSHAVHHYALVKQHCLAEGIELGVDFGKAPATLAHEKAATGA